MNSEININEYVIIILIWTNIMNNERNLINDD